MRGGAGRRLGSRVRGRKGRVDANPAMTGTHQARLGLADDRVSLDAHTLSWETSESLNTARLVSDHRGSNSQPIDFQGVEIYPVLTAKIENTEKSST